jgi:hypothetical protein
MIPTPSYKAAHNNGSQRESMSAQNPMMYAPNNNKMEPVHGRLNTSKGVWDLSQKNLFKYGETSQPQVDLSLPLSPVYDAQPSMSVKPEHQGDLSFDGELKTNAKKMIKDSILVTRSDIRGVKGIVKINARIPIPSKADGRRLGIGISNNLKLTFSFRAIIWADPIRSDPGQPHFIIFIIIKELRECFDSI